TTSVRPRSPASTPPCASSGSSTRRARRARCSPPTTSEPGQAVAAILFPVTSRPGVRPHEGGGRLVNAYAEALGEGAPAKYVIRRAPGLRSFAATAQSGFRGCFYDGVQYVYGAWSGILRKFTSAGTESAVGSLSGSG